MAECLLVVSNARGVHTRPATRIAQLVGQFQAQVIFHKGEQQAEGGSVISLLLLAAAHGETLRVEALGEDALQVLDALQQLFDDQLGDKEEVP
ncbi:MAG: HPr family phosphocarrier protein [Magnetococcales bacterium]|nr:HPr family phosphocarrier protein [Magnetococcales bacterium]